MTQLTTVVLRLEVSDLRNAGTEDNLYVFLHGHSGGREFSLRAPGADTFRRGTESFLLLGDPETFGIDASRFNGPHATGPGQENDPARYPVEVEEIYAVGLRKAGTRRGSGDDVLMLRDAVVLSGGVADGGGAVVTTWAVPRDLTPPVRLGNEYGLTVWLRQFDGDDALELRQHDGFLDRGASSG